MTLKEAREKKGFSMTELAEQAGITTQAIWNYENGVRVPRDEVKVRLAEILDCGVSELFYTEVHEA